MRRWLWVVGLSAVLILGGCRRQTPVAEPIGDGFTCTLNATYRDMVIGGTLTRAGGGTLTLTFTAPETLRDLAAVWDGESVTLQWHGLSFSGDPATVPQAALGEELVAVLDTALRGEGEREADGDTVTLRGSGDNGSYAFTYDAATGEPRTLSVPSLPLEVTFSEFEKN